MKQSYVKVTAGIIVWRGNNTRPPASLTRWAGLVVYKLDGPGWQHARLDIDKHMAELQLRSRN